jgi:excinuclease ABC subunit C
VISMLLEEKLKILPALPGVYLFKDEQGRVIYVGKAVSLKNRVKSYFSSQHNDSPKTKALVKNIRDLEYIITDSEVEALILESNLIKKHKPKYNIRLTDDKSYPYLQVTVQEAYPRLEIVRSPKKDGARYFGPYTNVGAVHETLKLLKKLFPLRSCKQTSFVKQDRPCLNAYIKRCAAPCQGLISRVDYRKMIEEVILFLEGRQGKLARKLKKRMNEAAENLEFEKAAELRDQLLAVEKVIERQKIVSNSFEDLDVLNFARSPQRACMQILFVRGGKVTGGDHFMLEAAQEMEGSEVVLAFLKQYYHRAELIPPQILLPEKIEEQEILETWLQGKRGGKVALKFPQRGQKKELLELAVKNAEESLQRETKLRAEKEKQEAEALEEITRYLGLAEVPCRMECYDISNIQGIEAVASMVVFEKGRANASQYRRFKIKTVTGADDFASMAEVIRRRFKKAQEGDARFSSLPDLVIVDGGKGQLSAARKVMKELGFGEIATVGLAEENEWIFREDYSEPLILPHNSPGLYLLQRIRDEAHRFALTYHRLLRGRRNLASVLDDIPGLGPKRKTALLQHFQFSLQKIRRATLEELQQVEGLGRTTAFQVWNFFHTGEEG